jgi:hypothetical protein
VQPPGARERFSWAVHIFATAVQKRGQNMRSAMFDKPVIASAIIVLAAVLLAPASPGYAQAAVQQTAAQRQATAQRAAAQRHSGPGPIWQWRNHQPREDQLKALHKNDLTPDEAAVVDQLYEQLEAPNWPAGQTVTLNCPRHHLECRVNGKSQQPN